MKLTAEIVKNLEKLYSDYQEVRLISRDQARIDKQWVVWLHNMRWREYSELTYHDDFFGNVPPTKYYEPEYTGI